MMTEKILELIYGKNYLKNEINFNIQLPIVKNDDNEENNKGNEMKDAQGDETGIE